MAGNVWMGREELFQFTHPRGVRLSSSVDLIGSVDVSIHSPARGATDGLLVLLTE